MHKTLSKERIQQLRSVGGNRIWRFDTTVFWSLMKPWKFNSNDGGIYTYDMTYFQKLLLHNRASIIILSNPDYYLLFSWNPTSLRPVRHSRSQPGAGESSSHSCTFFADTPPPPPRIARRTRLQLMGTSIMGQLHYDTDDRFNCTLHRLESFQYQERLFLSEVTYFHPTNHWWIRGGSERKVDRDMFWKS